MGQTAELVRVKFKYELAVDDKKLYSYVSRPIFLEEWFAEEVDIEEDLEGNVFYTFTDGNGNVTRARIVQKVPNKLLKLEWIEHPIKQGQTLIFQVNNITAEDGQTILYVFDSCNQLKIKLLQEEWDSIINRLKGIIG